MYTAHTLLLYFFLFVYMRFQLDCCAAGVIFLLQCHQSSCTTVIHTQNNNNQKHKANKTNCLRSMAGAYFTGLWIGQKAAVVVVVYAVVSVIIIVITLRLLRIIGALPVYAL